MAGKKYGVILAAKVPGSYFAMSPEARDEPGKVFEELAQKYEGKIEFLRRYWTSAFTAEVSDVFVLEADDPMDVHNLSQDMTRMLAAGGDPDRFGVDVKVWFGVNPDAG